jgi:hypothetical protein
MSDKPLERTLGGTYNPAPPDPSIARTRRQLYMALISALFLIVSMVFQFLTYRNYQDTIRIYEQMLELRK